MRVGRSGRGEEEAEVGGEMEGVMAAKERERFVGICSTTTV